MVMEKFNRSESAQKFMQVGIDVKCMHTNFGGCDHSGFGDMATFQKRPNFPFRAWTSPWSWKNSINRNRLKKFMQVGIDVKCMQTNFGGRDSFTFEDMATFQKWPNFPFGAWSSKILIDRNQLNRFMQIGVDVKYMHIDFGGRGLSSFGDIATFKFDQISLLDHGL